MCHHILDSVINALTPSSLFTIFQDTLCFHRFSQIFHISDLRIESSVIKMIEYNISMCLRQTDMERHGETWTDLR